MPKIIDKQLDYDSFFKINEYTIDDNGENYKRFVLSRPTAACVVLFVRDRQELILVRQYRVAAEEHKENPMLIELPAGIVEDGEKSEEAVKREALEETGYKINDLTHITTCFASPGICSELFSVFYAEVSAEDRVDDGGGRDDENENIEVLSLGKEEVFKMLDQNEIKDAKTLLGLMWFRLHMQ